MSDLIETWGGESRCTCICHVLRDYDCTCPADDAYECAAIYIDDMVAEGIEP